MAEFRPLSAWEIAELTKRTRKNTNGVSKENPRDKHKDLAEYLDRSIKPYAEHAVFPMSVIIAARLIAQSCRSNSFDIREQVINFASLIFTRQCIGVFSYHTSKDIYRFGVDEFIAFAALSRNYTIACDENPRIKKQIERVGHENIRPAFINECLPLGSIVERTGYALTDLGYTEAARELLIPKKPDRKIGSMPLIKRVIYFT